MRCPKTITEVFQVKSFTIPLLNESYTPILKLEAILFFDSRLTKLDSPLAIVSV
jgi:hypothetical protein